MILKLNHWHAYNSTEGYNEDYNINSDQIEIMTRNNEDNKNKTNIKMISGRSYDVIEPMEKIVDMINGSVHTDKYYERRVTMS